MLIARVESKMGCHIPFLLQHTDKGGMPYTLSFTTYPFFYTSPSCENLRRKITIDRHRSPETSEHI